jgi:6-phosphogluconate dehydrogenase-like protein
VPKTPSPKATANASTEGQRLANDKAGKGNWRQWGPYVSERQWGTVREDYSPGGTAWDYLPHDHARSRAYRWGEDGIAGFSDDHQHLCLSLALWNGQDPILKERLFGLTNSEGNHGEDVKELYYYLDATPSHSYLKMLYKYPQREFPYAQLVEENGRRKGDGSQPELELLDTGIFDDDRYFNLENSFMKKETTMQIGMIGLGRMGANMVRRLIKDGHQCVVYDRSPDTVKQLAKEKATGASSLADFVKKLAKHGIMAAYAEGLGVLRDANIGKKQGDIDAETTPLRNPEHYQYDLNLTDITEVWRRGSVIASWLLDLTANSLVEDPNLAKFAGRVSDSGEGRWTIKAAVDEGVPVPVLTAALYERFTSRGEADYQDKLLSAMRFQFGGHLEKSAK